VMQHRIDVVEDVPLGDRLVAVVILEPHQRRERDVLPPSSKFALFAQNSQPLLAG